MMLSLLLLKALLLLAKSKFGWLAFEDKVKMGFTDAQPFGDLLQQRFFLLS